MHRMALTAQEFFADGYSVSELDGANAFNSASRQAMLMAVLRECPHMARLFWMGYCSHSPLVLMRLAGSFAVLLSQEGARMGDKFGSFVPPLMTSRALPGTLLTCVVCSWLPLRSSSSHGSHHAWVCQKAALCPKPTLASDSARTRRDTMTYALRKMLVLMS